MSQTVLSVTLGAAGTLHPITLHFTSDHDIEAFQIIKERAGSVFYDVDGGIFFCHFSSVEALEETYAKIESFAIKEN